MIILNVDDLYNMTEDKKTLLAAEVNFKRERLKIRYQTDHGFCSGDIMYMNICMYP